MTPDVQIIKKGDTGYPALLGHIADPPEQLYCRGNIALLDTFCIGVVGTRRISEYGRQATADVAGNLATAGVTVVSGLALGVDAAAHRAALGANGKTIAVLGSGIDDATIGPRENLPLARDILANDGLLISEYPVGYPADRWTFPQRNRIISGLSRGVLIVEADRESGSLITAKCALEQNRDVFAIPGSIYWPRSVGANWLIQQGARPVLCAADILETYRLKQVPLPAAAALSTDDPVQRAILQVLRENGPTHLDTIVAQCGVDASRTMSALAMLDIAGAVRHEGRGIYIIQ